MGMSGYHLNEQSRVKTLILLLASVIALSLLYSTVPGHITLIDTHDIEDNNCYKYFDTTGKKGWFNLTKLI